MLISRLPLVVMLNTSSYTTDPEPPLLENLEVLQPVKLEMRLARLLTYENENGALRN